jgi:hypothetical protein
MVCKKLKLKLQFFGALDSNRDIGAELTCADRRQNPVTVGNTVAIYSNN